VPGRIGPGATCSHRSLCMQFATGRSGGSGSGVPGAAGTGRGWDGFAGCGGTGSQGEVERDRRKRVERDRRERVERDRRVRRDGINECGWASHGRGWDGITGMSGDGHLDPSPVPPRSEEEAPLTSSASAPRRLLPPPPPRGAGSSPPSPACPPSLHSPPQLMPPTQPIRIRRGHCLAMWSSSPVVLAPPTYHHHHYHQPHLLRGLAMWSSLQGVMPPSHSWLAAWIPRHPASPTQAQGASPYPSPLHQHRPGAPLAPSQPLGPPRSVPQ
jgi:hypothetical protein